MKSLKATFCLVGIAAAMFTACSSAPEQTLTVSGLDPAKFDTLINEKPVKLYTLKNHRCRAWFRQHRTVC